MDAATKAEALLKINALSPLVGRQDAGLDDRWKQLVSTCCEIQIAQT
jgi:hypothetical protein